MGKECNIDIFQQLNFSFAERYVGNFLPDPLSVYETEFLVSSGRLKRIQQMFNKQREEEEKVYLGFYSPQGIFLRVEILGISDVTQPMDALVRGYIAHRIKALVVLDHDTEIMLADVDESPEFGY